MKKLIIALAVAAAAAPGMALAGGGVECASAVELTPGAVVDGDTSDNVGSPNPGGNIGGFGFFPSTGPVAIYTFTSDGQATDPMSITVTGGFASGAAAYLTAACSNNPGSPITNNSTNSATGTFELPISQGGAALTAGTQYFVFVANNPTDNSGQNGTYNLTAPDPLPVALQSFSID